MRLTVLIRPKAGILDPQGEAVRASLVALGFAVTSARVGRLVDLEVAADDEAAARTEVERMCAAPREPAHRGFEIVAGRERVAPRIAVVTFPGSNDDGDAALALEHLGAEAVPVWRDDSARPRHRRRRLQASRTATTSAAAHSPGWRP
jgi:phosphoribosylformylglycinamidine synthase